VLSKEFDQGINCAGKLVCWVAQFSYLLALKRRFSNLLYLDLELFSVFGERNRILRVGSVHKRCVIKNLPDFFRFLIFLPSSRIKAFECAFLVWKVVQERPWVFAPCTLFKILRQEDGVCCWWFSSEWKSSDLLKKWVKSFLRCFDAKYMILNCTDLDDCPPKYLSS
jgi:hypothetical protein